VDEVATLERAGLREGRTASRALGYAQVLRFLAGECSEEDARAQTILATRRFARRQEAWFRRDPRVTWLAADGGDAGALLDDAAKASYRRRLDDLREDLDEAERFHDVERAARLREELDFISAELARAVGLGGRDRRAGNAAERARVNVTRAIRGAVRAIAEHDARLGHHLERSVRTGVFCAYQPGPEGPDTWRVTGER
jgi:IPP transferase